MSAAGPGTGRLFKRKRSSSEQVVPGSSTSILADTTSSLRWSPGHGAGNDCDPRSPFSDPNYPIPDFNNVYAKMRNPVSGVNIADRRHNFRSYRKCFIGTESVDWMTKNLQVDRETAVDYGKRLMNAGIITHVTQSEPFEDGYFFFRFQEDDESNVLNMKRVWDPKIETRPPVLVSQELLTRLACLCEEHREHIIAAKNQKFSEHEKSIRDSSTERSDRPPVSPELNQGRTGAHSPSNNGILQSPLLGSFPRSFINSLAPYTFISGSPNLLRGETKAGERKYDPESGDDIDFSLLAKSERFRQYTLDAAELQRVQLAGLNDDELMAFFVNLYNILCLHAYVEHGPPSSFWRRWIFFRSLSYRAAGLDMSLDDIEHGILRGNKRHPTLAFMQQLRPSDPKCQFVLTSRDGRIHFVISAGTRSDPPVRILNGENLQEELYEATIEFLGCSVKVDKETKKVSLPQIFRWYSDDFPTPETELLRWIARFLSDEKAQDLTSLLDEPTKPTVVYESYEWCNPEARFEASEIRRKRRKLLRECAPSIPKESNTNELEQLFTTPFLGAQPHLLSQSHPRAEATSESVVSHHQIGKSS